jgi:hypothetical protein
MTSIYIHLHIITAHNVPYHQPNTLLTHHNRPQCATLVIAVETALFSAQYELNSSVSTSECSRKHFISEKYKTVQSFKLPFLQNGSFMQLHTSASDCKVGGNIPGSFFAKAFFSSSVAFLMMSLASQKLRTLNADFNEGNRYKSAGAKLGEYGGCSNVVTLFFVRNSLTKIDQYAGELPERRNQPLVPHFSGRFLLTASLRQQGMLMYISSPQAAIPVNYTIEFQELFEAIKYI